MRRNPLRPLPVLVLTVVIVVTAFGFGNRLISRLMAAETAELNSFLPAVFNLAGGQPPMPTATAGSTRPAKATETIQPTVEGTTSPTATRTPTPEFTSTPGSLPTTTPGYVPVTPSATPSPTPQTTQAIVLPNDSWYIDKAHDLHVVGEVRNNGTTTIQFVNLKATFYTRSGIELDDMRVYAELTILPPGEKTCFEFLLPEPQGFAFYEFADVQHLPPTLVQPTLEILTVIPKFQPSIGAYSLEGALTNVGTELLQDVRAIGTIYDSGGIVRGCQSVPVGVNDENVDLPAGELGLFQMSFAGRDNSDVTTYRVQPDGRYVDEEGR